MARFDTLAGIYVYAMDHHDGQWSRLYRLMCRIDARLSDTAIRAIRGTIGDDPYNEWADAREVYRSLAHRNAR